MHSDIRKVVYALYAFIFFSFFYMIFFTCKRKGYTHEYSKSVVSQTDSPKEERKTEKPKILFNLQNLTNNQILCLFDTIIIEDTVKSFKNKICYWGDNDSSIYSDNETRKYHKYVDPGMKSIRLVCDSFIPASWNILVNCHKPDIYELSIHPPDRPNISQDTLIFNKDLKLNFESIVEGSKWRIDGKLYNSDVQITFKKHQTIEVTYIPGKTNDDCICDSTMKLTFAKIKK